MKAELVAAYQQRVYKDPLHSLYGIIYASKEGRSTGTDWTNKKVTEFGPSK